MKVLITGATGLVGSELVKLCRADHIEVNYLTTSREKIRTEEGYTGFYWNPENEEIDIDCFQGVSAVVNLAGASISKRWTKSYKKTVLSSRIDSLRTLYKGMAAYGKEEITTLVSASAIGKYPNSLSEFYTEETSETDDSFLGQVVDVWEKEINTFKALGLKVATIRVGLVLSANGGALPEMAKPIKNYVGAAFGSGEQWQSWIHIQDLARIFLFAIKEEVEGVFNGVAPNPVTNTKLVKEIAEVLKKPLILPNIPQFMMRLVLGEMAYLLFASQRVSSKKIEDAGFGFRYQNVNAALSDIYTLPNSHEAGENVLNGEYS